MPWHCLAEGEHERPGETLKGTGGGPRMTHLLREGRTLAWRVRFNVGTHCEQKERSHSGTHAERQWRKPHGTVHWLNSTHRERPKKSHRSTTCSEGDSRAGRHGVMLAACSRKEGRVPWHCEAADKDEPPSERLKRSRASRVTRLHGEGRTQARRVRLHVEIHYGQREKGHSGKYAESQWRKPHGGVHWLISTQREASRNDYPSATRRDGDGLAGLHWRKLAARNSKRGREPRQGMSASEHKSTVERQRRTKMS